MPVEAQATVVWFKRDLRTLDHRPLAEAAPWARRSAARCRAGLVAEPDASHRQYAWAAWSTDH
jgi:deoxyribodipyrimidine photolyase